MKTILTVFLTCCMSMPILAQNLAVFSGTKTPAAASIPNVTATPLSRGPGLTVAGGNTFNSGNWATGGKLDVNDYIEWSVAAAPGYILNIKELQINFDRDPDGMSHFFTGNGPAKIRLRTSLNNFKSDIYAHDKVSNSGQSPNIETNLTSEPGGAITFRLYGFAANIGMLGPLGTFDIEGGLGTLLGLENTGIRIAGKLTYDGLLFSEGKWSPHPPTAETKDKNILISDGIYKIMEPIHVNNLIITPEAQVIVEKSGAILVNGDLETSDKLLLKSNADQFSSLIIKEKITGTASYELLHRPKNAMDVANNSSLFSAPVSGEDFKTFRTTNANFIGSSNKSLFSFGPFNTSKGIFTKYSPNEKEILATATGYKVTSNNFGHIVFTGKVNTGEIKKTIGHSGSKKTEWNLIGNPYTSALDLSELLNSNAAQFAAESFGIYEQDPYSNGGWSIKNLAYLTLHPNTKIDPGQGFMVASKPAGGAIVFLPSMQRMSNNGGFKISKDTISEKVGFLKLQLSNGIQNATTDFYFNSHSTHGLDKGYDAAVFGGSAPEFAIFSRLVDLNSNLDYAIQSIPYKDLRRGVRIPLGLNVFEGQDLTISIHKEILPSETKVYLEDTLNQTFTLLSNNAYSFFTGTKEINPNRFFLHFKKSTLSFGENEIHNTQLYTSNGGNTLHITEVSDNNSIVSVYSIDGRLLLKETLNADIVDHKINLSMMESGMYLVKLRTGSFEKLKSIRISKKLDKHI